MKTKPTRGTSITPVATRRNGIRLSLLAVLGNVISLTPLHAGVVFNFAQMGSDVVATTSGSIAAGWSVTSSPSTIATQALLASTAIRYQKDGVTRFVNDTGNWTYNPLGGEFIFEVGVATGDAFGYSGDTTFYAPAGTAVGDAFTPNTTMTWANETLESLGLDTRLSTEPMVVFTLDNGDTIRAVRSGPAPVPEPGTWAAAALLVGGAALARWRRRQSAAKKRALGA